VIAGAIYLVDIIDFTQSTSSPNTIKLYVHRQG